MAALLGHFGVPMIVTSDEGVITLMTDGEAAAVMQSQVDSLRALGFDHSEVLHSEVIVLNVVVGAVSGNIVAPQRRWR